MNFGLITDIPDRKSQREPRSTPYCRSTTSVVHLQKKCSVRCTPLTQLKQMYCRCIQQGYSSCTPCWLWPFQAYISMRCNRGVLICVQCRCTIGVWKIGVLLVNPVVHPHSTCRTPDTLILIVYTSQPHAGDKLHNKLSFWSNNLLLSIHTCTWQTRLR